MVTAVATAVLPDGRPVAVTGSRDNTVRIWELTLPLRQWAASTPIGNPLRGHTQMVTAVATAVLPDGRAIAVSGSDDRTVRIWDLTAGTPMEDPLAVLGTVAAIAALEAKTSAYVAIVGDGILALQLRSSSL